MPKEFDRWNSKKKEINSRADDILFHDREIWWCSLGVNVGSEQDGVSSNFERPMLIIKKFNRRVLWAVPLTRTIKPGNPNYFVLEEKESAVKNVSARFRRSLAPREREQLSAIGSARSA
jgi:mRNA interferase MazF